MEQLKLTVNFKKKYQMKRFMQILAWMELCGNVGHFTNFLVGLDGDGNARPKFVFEDEDTQNIFDEMRSNLCKEDLKTIPNIKNVGSVDTAFLID